MRYPRKWQLAGVCLLALTLLTFAPAPRGTAQAPGYTVTDLGTLGGLESRAYGLDECGRVVGESQAAAGESAPFRPFHWNGTTLTDLGTLGGNTGLATSLNQTGTIVGSSLTSGGLLRPFVLPPGGTMINLNSLGGFTAEAQDVNASGQVVGQSEDGSLQDRAFIWQDANHNGVSDAGEMQALTAPWGTPIRAFGINDAGQIAGSANLSSSGTHAFVTIGGVAVDLGTLGGSVSVATDVNDTGEVAGYSYIFSPTITQSFHAFRWKDLNGNGQSEAGEMTDLGVLSGDRNSYAYDVNNSGQVVGYSENGLPGDSNVTRAFLWTSANGMQNLNAVVTGTGWTFQEARGINDRGQIVGTGLNPDGKVHAFLLTPTNAGPSPCDPTPTPTPVPGALQFSASAYAVGEDGGSVVISVSRTGGDDGAVSVNYATADGGSATAGSDYTATSGTLTFPDGETTKTFSVTVSDDTLDESDETVNLSLSAPGGGASLGSPTTAVLTITDNDTQPTLQFSSPTYSVAENGTTATITVTRTGGTNGGATVNYATAPGTAHAGPDFTGTGGTLTFAAGDNSETFTVAIANDALDEPDETVNLSLSVPGGGAVLGAQTTAVLTINDDDATPTLSIGDVTVTEGNTGNSPSTTATFAVTLNGASSQTVTVNYATADGSATQPADYSSASGTVTFTPGETGAKNVNVLVNGDTADEPNETFNVNLSNASASATISDAQGVVTINDDDGAPSLNISDVSVIEGNTGTTAATFTVSLLPASGQTVTVNYATADGTATAGSDYTAVPSTTLTFTPGQTTKTVTVNVTGETTPEAHENFVVNLSGPTNAELGDAQGLGTINNDDTTLSIADQIAGTNEGNSGETSVVFTVSLSHVSALPVSVNYSTADVTATAGSDYVAANGTLTIPAGSTTGTITVQVKGDNTFENDLEEFVVNLSGATNAVIADAQGRAWIRNDELASLFQISGGPNFAVAEGGVKTTFTITRTGSTAGGATVNYATANGTATAGADYTAVSGSFTFAEGETSRNFDVFVTDDTFDEPDETVTVSLTPGFGASAGTASSVTLNITDDDAPPSFQFSSATYGVTEGDGVVTVNITVTRAGGTNAASVNYATSDGTATATDYASSFGTLNFAAGETSKTFGVSVAGDTLDEPNETVNLSLSAGPGVVIGTQGTAVLTITDNDAQPTVQFSSATYTVGESGTTATVTVTRTGGTNGGVTVNYATSNGTAAQPGDYTAAGGTLTFTEGDNSETFTVVVASDALDEPDETVNLSLSSPGGGAALGAQTTAVLTITDDDAPPTLSISDATAAEAQGTASFNVMLSAPSGRTVTVSYSTADGTAVAPGDYLAVPSSIPNTLTFAPGETSKPATVTVNNDALNEIDETFNVTLSGATNASISNGAAVGTIDDDDEPPSLSINDRNNIQENVAGAIFVVTLSAPSGRTVTVNYATADGTALAGSDYTTSSGTLTFAPGVTSQELAVFTSNDNLDEANETYFVNLSDATNATIADAQGTGTIVDDDATPTLSINDVTAVELGGVATFKVTLSAPSGQAVTVKYATADGTADTVTDYTATSGTLTFSPGQTSQDVNVQLGSDNFDEPDQETFFVNLSDATNATIADAQGVGTINDNDATPALSINDVTVTEGNSGTINATFTVSLGPGSGQTVTVNYATANNTAAAPGDYAAQSGTLTFGPLEVSKTVTVQVSGDTENEPNESFYVILSNPTHASILDTHGECFITNDDAPAVRFSQAAYPVGEGAHFVTVTVTRTGDPLMPFGVDFATSDGTATARRDYTAVSGKLQFASGETSKTFDVLLTEDSFQESEETINLTLSNPTGVVALGAQPTATVNIAADDANQPQPNPIDESSNFVRQHYHDFLNREPDASGLAFWTGEIEGCGANASCREAKRINVSAAFFLSIEFQQTGYLVYRTFKAAHADTVSPNVAGSVPVVRLEDFLPDTRRIGEGVVVGEPNWEQKLEANKQAYMAEFVRRPRFFFNYPLGMSAEQFVAKLNQNSNNVLSQAEREQLVAQLAPNPDDMALRAAVLRAVAEHPTLQQNEFRRAFVLMQYYGYLRRNPDDAPDSDFRGWKFWLDKLNEFNGNYVNAEMVKAFLDSIEYRTRFAP